ncbi:MAG: division/cell wall cluster transcriptional repressor MraZ [Blastopirellula sp.]|nr:MAG: division/cell wall cluster transcriptional repressor MraZ [Blastopirellula sp.]
MAQADFILGEFKRKLDERYRLSIPTEFVESLTEQGEELILVKERPGCLSLWNSNQWQGKLDAGVNLVRAKIEAGKLAGRVAEVQLLGRLLSTRQRQIKLAAKNRLSIPEGFREFLKAEPDSELMITGAAVCVEIWRHDAWLSSLEENIPQFQGLLDQLSG